MASSSDDWVFGRGTVDLVGQQHVAEHRAGVELEGALALVEDRRAGDVARKHVGGALHALGGGVDRLGDRPGQHGLTGAGNVLEENVAFAQDGDQGEANDLVLALEDRLDVLDDLVEVLLERLSVQRSGAERLRGGSRLLAWPVYEVPWRGSVLTSQGMSGDARLTPVGTAYRRR